MDDSIRKKDRIGENLYFFFLIISVLCVEKIQKNKYDIITVQQSQLNKFG